MGQKRKTGILALVLCMLAGACTAAETDVSAVQEKYAQAQCVSAEADITTHTGVLADYTIAFERADGVSTSTLLKPESLAGISASAGENGAQITYENIALETLLPPLCGFVPVDALSGVLDDLAGGIPVEICEEKTESGQSTVLSYESSFEDCEGLKRVWLEKDTLAVMRAEFYLNGQMIMSMDVKNMSFSSQTIEEKENDS